MPCTSSSAAFRLVRIVPGGAECGPYEAYVNEPQAGADTIAPLLCLEAVTR